MNYKELIVCCLMTFNLPLLADPQIAKIATEQAPKAIGPYSQAIQAGSFIFLSGQIGIDPVTGNLAGETLEAQTVQTIKNIEAILAAQGLTLENVVRSEVAIMDLNDFTAMNTIYASKFKHEIQPARTTVQVSKLPKNALIEISCTAYIPQ